ncbi:iron-sulfur cluster assembly scaffold protein [Spectribacter hydrogenooxidans]|uniref:Iron-sulfur cluster assembly scaffold protein n=1 Tax=Spectribacter hydrogenoxidans TaxID=3075608 RepID=A0ABU3BYH7_9GAMM|nr:iron-sulfur cluster assembly scaffold protein [Salinisphaera sp. W335]MDT0634366.1 iron-sulfur cluster assembly scaffold protein [Salinisphaera sp. W335]
MQLSGVVHARFFTPANRLEALRPGAIPGRAETPDAYVALWLWLDHDRVREAAFRVRGCPVTVAAADYVCERVRNRTRAAARGLTVAEMEQALSSPPERRGALLVVSDALTSALEYQPVEA